MWDGLGGRGAPLAAFPASVYSAHPTWGAATSITLQVRRGSYQLPQLIAQVTVAYLPSKTIDEDAGLVDQSRLPSSLLSTIIQWAQLTRQLVHRPVILAALLPGFGLRCPERLG